MPNTRTLIVCLPDDTTTSMLSAATVIGDHVDGPALLHPVFPVRHRRLVGWLTRWLTYFLIAPRRRRTGTIVRAAGGRKGRLDLAGAARTGFLTAAARWAYWQRVVAGTRPAAPWEHYLARHQATPERLSLHEARRRFLSQPRIQAMRIASAVPGARFQLDPYEVDAYQAGPHAYATRHQLAALAGDAMLTTTGEFLQPASGSFADVTDYLRKAAGHLHALGRRQQVIALTI
jgi:hypothetical protein